MSERRSTGSDGTGERIRNLRIARNITQRELAGARYSVSYISAVERGRVRPSLDLVQWCAQQLRVSDAQLLGDSMTVSQRAATARQAVAEEAYRQVQAALLLASGDTSAALSQLRQFHLDAGETASPDLVWRHAYASCLAGELDEAIRAAESYAHLAESAGNPRLVASAHWLWGLIHAYQGQSNRAIEEYRGALALGEHAVLDPDFLLAMRETLAEALLRAGHVDSALELHTRALQDFEAFADPMERAQQAAQQAEVAAGTGDFVSAYTLARWAWTSMREVRARRIAARLYLLRMLLSTDSVPLETHEWALQRAMTLAKQAQDETTLALAAACLVQVIGAHRSPDEAEDLLRASFPDNPPGVDATPLVLAARSLAQGFVAQARGESEEALRDAHAAEAAMVQESGERYPDLTPGYLALMRLYELLNHAGQAMTVFRRVFPTAQRFPRL